MSEKKKVVILGAGVAGLAAGYCLARTNKFSVTVLEKAPVSGGLCGSFDYNGHTLDYGPHKIYSVIPGVLDEICGIMGDRLLKLEKKNRIYLKGHLLDYPLKLGNLIKAFGFLTFLKLGFGYALTVLKGIFYRQPPRSYEEYMKKCFGTPAYQMVFQPLAEKTWGDPKKLHSEMARTRVPASGGLEIMLKLLGLKKETAATNARFCYVFCPCFKWVRALSKD
jgi:protoporphyrinogen oxidase